MQRSRAPAGRRQLEPQPRVLVTALGTTGQLAPGRRGVKRITSDAMKRRSPALQFEALVIASIVPQPQPEKDRAHKDAEDRGSGGQVEHCPTVTTSNLARQRSFVHKKTRRGKPRRVGESVRKSAYSVFGASEGAAAGVSADAGVEPVSPCDFDFAAFLLFAFLPPLDFL